MSRKGKKVITTSLAAAVVFAAVWLGVHRQRTPPPPDKVFVVSKPRTVATLPSDPPCAYGVSWLDKNTLILWYGFTLHWPKRAAAKPAIAHDLYGIVRVDLRTGKGNAVRPPLPIGGSPRTIWKWSDESDSGEPASVRLPPLRFGDGGILSFNYPSPSPTNDLIAYTIEAFGIDGKPLPNSPQAGLWISRSDGSRARRIVPGDAAPVEWSPDGRTLLFCKRKAGASSRDLWACRSDGSRARLVAARMLCQAQFSSDSRKLACERREVHVIDMRSGGRPVLVVREAANPVWVGGSLLCTTRTIKKRFDIRHFLRRRRLTSVGEMVRAVEAIDPVTGARTMLMRFEPDRSVWMVAPAKDIGAFVMVENPQPKLGGRCWLYSLTPDGLDRVPLPADMDWAAWSPDGRRLAYVHRGEIKVVDVTPKTVKRP